MGPHVAKRSLPARYAVPRTAERRTAAQCPPLTCLCPSLKPSGAWCQGVSAARVEAEGWPAWLAVALGYGGQPALRRPTLELCDEGAPAAGSSGACSCSAAASGAVASASTASAPGPARGGAAAAGAPSDSRSGRNGRAAGGAGSSTGDSAASAQGRRDASSAGSDGGRVLGTPAFGGAA